MWKFYSSNRNARREIIIIHLQNQTYRWVYSNDDSDLTNKKKKQKQKRNYSISVTRTTPYSVKHLCVRIDGNPCFRTHVTSTVVKRTKKKIRGTLLPILHSKGHIPSEIKNQTLPNVHRIRAMTRRTAGLDFTDFTQSGWKSLETAQNENLRIALYAKT